jgi:hypothetical protein
MSLTESLSIFPEVFNEHYTISHAKHVFSRMRDRCPVEYEEKKISIRKAAELLNVDHRTLHQRIRLKLMKTKNEKSDNGYTKKIFVSLRDLSDMLIEKPFKKCAGINQNRYTKQEIEELLKTGKVIGRSYNSYKIKAHRLGFKLKNLKNQSPIETRPRVL